MDKYIYLYVNKNTAYVYATHDIDYDLKQCVNLPEVS